MNGSMEFRCAALLAFLAMIVVPSSLRGEGDSSAKHATVEKSSFGKLSDGTEIEQYTLTNAKGAVAKVITYGATLSELWIPDKAGKNADVPVLSFHLPVTPGTSLSALLSAATATSSMPRANSPSDGKSIRSFFLNNGPNLCTAAKSASIAKSGKPSQ
jgi:hypothetical protein